MGAYVQAQAYADPETGTASAAETWPHVHGCAVVSTSATETQGPE